jgi:hypothetical protein
MHGVARLSKVTFLGELTAVIQSWFAGSNLNVEVQGGYDYASVSCAGATGQDGLGGSKPKIALTLRPDFFANQAIGRVMG